MHGTLNIMSVVPRHTTLHRFDSDARKETRP